MEFNGRPYRARVFSLANSMFETFASNMAARLTQKNLTAFMGFVLLNGKDRDDTGLVFHQKGIFKALA